MEITKKPTMLMILDGFGINDEHEGNAIYQANTPHLDKIFASYPYTTVRACGLDVGLPEGQMGNSEVGHLNIGAGRIIYQELTRITKSIEDGDFFENLPLIHAMDHAAENGSTLHIMGLVSDGGVHSHISHLLALLDMAKSRGLKSVEVHSYLDGRDVPPRCAITYLEQLENHMKAIGLGQIGVVSGRYYAMDRDKRWERIMLAYDALTLGKGEKAKTAISAVEAAYDRNENDEFVLPTVIDSPENPFLPISDNDAVIMFNFRPDRARQITRALVDDNFDGFVRTKYPKNLHYTCMTQYDASMPNVEVSFPPESYRNTLGEYISSLGLKQLRIAETEKYAHVTFFFNGGVEAPNPEEDRELIPSPKVATYDLQPEMSAFAVTEKVLEKIATEKYDMIILNFANADMVGHTGIMEAAIKAIETLDICVSRIVDAVLAKDGQILLTADHGNADCMIDENSQPMTAHSLNVVPLLHIAKEPCSLSDGGKLADLAPTLLALMGLPQPPEMTGRSLLK